MIDIDVTWIMKIRQEVRRQLEPRTQSQSMTEDVLALYTLAVVLQGVKDNLEPRP